MTFTSMALKNVKMNLKKYSMFFFSIAFSVFTYFTFINLYNTKEVIETYKKSTKVNVMLQSFSVVILVFLVLFLWYSNRQFLKSRKKEIATYALYGLPYRKIGRLILIENLIIGITAMLIGIGIGVLFSKLMAMLLLYLISTTTSGVDVSFSINIKALIQTIIVFMSVFLLISFNGYRVVYKFKLIELFKADKTGDRKVKGSFVLLILALLLVVGGYVLASQKDPVLVLKSALIVLGMTIAGSYLFFYSGLPLLMRLVTKNSKFYYKGNNLLSMTQFMYRIRSNAAMMATIAVLSAVAMTAVASTYGLYYMCEKTSYDNIVFDMYYVEGGEIQDSTVDEIINSYKKHHITSDYTFDINTARVTPSKYKFKDVNVFQDNTRLRVVSESEYNGIVKGLPHINTIHLNSSEECAYLEVFLSRDIAEFIKANSFTFDNGVKLNVTQAIKQDGLNFRRSPAALVVKDQVYEELKEDSLIKKEDSVRGIMYSNSSRSSELVSDLKEVLPAQKVRFYFDAYSEMLGMFGMVTFIGVFMGIVFLLMTASLIYFKQLSEAEYDKPYFGTLRKIGLNEKRQKKIVGKQILPIFMLPLLIGTIHSMFAMKAAGTLLMNMDFKIPMLIMYSAYTFIYGLFYLVTKNQYNNVI